MASTKKFMTGGGFPFPGCGSADAGSSNEDGSAASEDRRNIRVLRRVSVP